MTAALYDEVVTGPAAPKQPSKRLHHSPICAGGDPLVEAAARLLSIPLREVYAVLWRVGLIEVTA